MNRKSTNSSAPAESVVRRRWLRRIGFPAAALLLGLSPFIILEAVLTAMDVGSPTGYADPFVGFSQVQSLFEKDQEGAFYRTVPSRTRYFVSQQFAAEKPSQGLRIFGFGGSTMQGNPYQPDTAFLKWLGLELCHGDTDRVCETVNCGALSYASYRLAPILEEVLNYEPDLIVIGTGHNEFLEDRTYQSIKARSAARAWIEDRAYSLRTVTLARQVWDSASPEADDDPDRTILPADVEAMLDRQSGYGSYHRDDQWRKQVTHHFDQTLRAMVSMCQKAGVPVVLVKLGSNLRDCPPFKSEHRADLTPDARLDWERAFDAATRSETDDLQQALVHYRNAEAIDGEYALLSFRIARCLDRLGRFEEARQYYFAAKELDVCPLRAIEEFDSVVSRIAADTGALLVDARALLDNESPQQIPGYDWYVDHVHPTVRGNQIIAQAIAETLRSNGVFNTDEWAGSERRRVYREYLDQLGYAYWADGRRRVSWLEHWARRERLFEETIPQDLHGYLRMGGRELKLDEPTRAWEQFDLALSEQPLAGANDILRQAVEFFQEGRLQIARDVLERLESHTTDPSLNAEIQLGLLVIALESGQMSTATSIYTEHQEAIRERAAQSSDWQAVMPDALERASRLVGTK